MNILGYKKIVVSETDRVVQFNNGQLTNILTPGVYRLMTAGKGSSFVNFSISSGVFEIQNLDILFNKHEALLSEHVELIKTGDTQIALTYLDGNLTDIIEPSSSKAFWKARGLWEFEIIDMDGEFKVSDRLVKTLNLSRNTLIRNKADSFIRYVEVAQNTTALVTECGDLIETLGSGRYGFWKIGRNIDVKLVDGRQHNLDVAGQEILSKDRVSLRLNLSAQYLSLIHI